jgi:CubicO group peptidase (beta-lactamase class C family)
MLANGVAAGDSILPGGWVEEATTPKTLRNGSPLDYGYLWWTAPTAAARKDGAFAGEGIYGQFLYVNPATQVVIVVWSARALPVGADAIDDWTFFDAVTAALRPRAGR